MEVASESFYGRASWADGGCCEPALEAAAAAAAEIDLGGCTARNAAAAALATALAAHPRFARLLLVLFPIIKAYLVVLALRLQQRSARVEVVVRSEPRDEYDEY